MTDDLVLPVHQTLLANQSVELYSGALMLENAEDVSARLAGDGTVTLSWLPSPRIVFDMSGPAVASDLLANRLLRGSPTLHLDTIGASATVDVQSFATTLASKSSETTRTRGVVSSVVVGDPTAFLDRLIFHIPNCVMFEGEPLEVSMGRGTRLYRGRLRMSVEDWSITLDERPEMRPTGDENTILDEGGFALTHAGCLKRRDSAAFREAEAMKILEAIGFAVSLAAGRRTMPILPVGYLGDEVRWQRWEVGVVEPSATRLSWFPSRDPGSLEAVVAGAHRRLTDPDWRDAVLFALGAFCEANGRTSLEPSLVLAQTGLELLSWAVLVREEERLSPDGFDKLSAHDRLRLLLSVANVPREIPTLLAALGKRTQQEQLDGPKILTELRNRIVHPPRRGGYVPQDIDEILEGSLLAQGYLELMLLRFLGYSGEYVDRTSVARFRGTTSPVPWAL